MTDSGSLGALSSLEFLELASASNALEMAKADPVWNADEIRLYESMLDRAWEMVGRVADGLGDRQARALADRCLWGMKWSDVATDCAMSMRTARRYVDDALAFLGRGSLE